MADKPSYSLAHDQRVREILESTKTSHSAPKPARNLDTASGEERRIPGSYQLEVPE
jgi:hypothetical protein